MISILLLLLSLLLHCEARFCVGRNRRHTCLVVQPCRRRLRRVAIGNVTAAIIGSGPAGLLLRLLLNRLQGIALVDSGHPMAPLVEHLPYLASAEGRREVTIGAGAGAAGGGRCVRVGVDGGGTDGAATASGASTVEMMVCRYGTGRGCGRGFCGGNHFHFALVPLLLLALLEAHLHLCKP